MKTMARIAITTRPPAPTVRVTIAAAAPGDRPLARRRSVSGSNAATTTAARTTAATTDPRIAAAPSATTPNAITASSRQPRLADWTSQSGTSGRGGVLGGGVVTGGSVMPGSSRWCTG